MFTNTTLGAPSATKAHVITNIEGPIITPTEDLMREHGVLMRMLLIYGEVLKRIEAKQSIPPNVLQDTARLVRNFIEDYHEKLEENYLFPMFKKPSELADLANILLTQHQKGRELTDTIIKSAGDTTSKKDNAALCDAIREFIRMYNPHAAREDTVLFPAFHKMMPSHEFEALGDKFEDKETELFGQSGFEKTVNQVALIEKKLGIADLSQFTPSR